MYTTAPIADLTNMHGGFYAYLFVCVVMYVFMRWAIHLVEPRMSIRNLRIFHLGYAVVWIALGSLVVHFSYMVPKTPPLNQKVISTFKRHVVQSEGKHNSPAYFAEFVVPEGIVLIRVPYGAPISDKVILYKN